MYREFYGFSGKPFQLTPDLKFLYPSAGYKRALSYLHYGLEQAEGFVVITGHIGTGKTLLIQSLLAELSDQEVATARLAAANLDKDNVVAAVAAALGQPFEGKSKIAILRTLEKSLIHAADYLKGVLLIVDEAQTLTSDALEELRILSNLESGGRALLQVFLIGQSELRSTLRRPNMEQLRQRVVASYHHEPLPPDETKRYIGYRLVAVGWNGTPSFERDFYAEVHRVTGGIPRKINMLMDRLLVYGFLEEVQAFDAGHIKAVMEEMSLEFSGDLAPGDSLAAPAVPRAIAPTEADGEIEAGHATATVQPATTEKGELEKRLRSLEARLEKLSMQPRRSGE